jgi:hypothetical protein
MSATSGDHNVVLVGDRAVALINVDLAASGSASWTPSCTRTSIVAHDADLRRALA